VPYNIKVAKVKPFQSISGHSKNAMELGALCCLIYSQDKNAMKIGDNILFGKKKIAGNNIY
jgi:hypothetical protein